MKSEIKKKWMKVDPMTFQINRVNGKLIQGDDEFAVWGLGKTSGFGVKWADITKRSDGYEVGIGYKGRGGKGWWKEKYPTRELALKNLIKKMRSYGRI